MLREFLRLIYGEGWAEGDLIDHVTGECKLDPFKHWRNLEPHQEVWVIDHQEKRSKLMKFEEIPPTFSYVPVPRNFEEECLLYYHVIGLVKHTIIFAKMQIRKEEFANVVSERNKRFRGRYMIARLPNIINFEP